MDGYIFYNNKILKTPFKFQIIKYNNIIFFGGYMDNKVSTSSYIHYYLLSIIFSIFIWGVFEYIIICNGMACMIDTSRLWKGLVVISSIFIPITLMLFPYILNSLKEFPKTLREMIEDLQNPQIVPFGLILKLAIVFICVCMFVLFFYYAGLNDFALKEKSVAATQANMFVVAATLFAPLAALIFVQDWKTQHNLKLFSVEAKNIWNLLDEEKSLWLEHRIILDSIPENTMDLKSITSYTNKFNDTIQKCKTVNIELGKLKNLTNDDILQNLLLDKSNKVANFKIFYKEKCSLGYGCTNTQFSKDSNNRLIDIQENIRKIEIYIRDKYILMK